MKTSEQGRQVDMDHVVQELAGKTKFLGGSRSGGEGTMGWALPTAQPVVPLA